MQLPGEPHRGAVYNALNCAQERHQLSSSNAHGEHYKRLSPPRSRPRSFRISLSRHLTLCLISATYAVQLNDSHAKADHGDRPSAFPVTYPRDKGLGAAVNVYRYAQSVVHLSRLLLSSILGRNEHSTVCFSASSTFLRTRIATSDMRFPLLGSQLEPPRTPTYSITPVKVYHRLTRSPPSLESIVGFKALCSHLVVVVQQLLAPKAASSSGYAIYQSPSPREKIPL